ncbi:UNVERIFIED_ORG: hypothetical protein J2S29_001269 [Rhizobium sp. SLBN-170]
MQSVLFHSALVAADCCSFAYANEIGAETFNSDIQLFI